MKKILKSAFIFSATCLAFAIFLSVGITNSLSNFVINKQLLNDGSIPVNLGDIISLSPQILFVLSVMFMLINKQKTAFVIGLLAVIFASLSLVIGSAYSANFIMVALTIVVAFIFLGIVIYNNKKAKQ